MTSDYEKYMDEKYAKINAKSKTCPFCGWEVQTEPGVKIQCEKCGIITPWYWDGDALRQPQAPDYGELWHCGMDHKGRIIITPAKSKILCGWANRAEICVNACVGIPNEILNSRFIVEAIQEKFERIKQKHDEQKGTNHAK